MTDLSTLLNPEQLAAATAPDGPLLILAAAGTGKTRTLVYRVAHLVERGVPPWGILLVTFTNRASREMLERAQAVIGTSADEIWGGTFHHIANRILRRFGSVIGYPSDFQILDEEDQKSIISAGIKSLGKKQKDFLKKDAVLSLISGAKNRKLGFQAFVEPKLDELSVDVQELVTLERFYEKRKEELHAMDFDDMLVNVLRLFREHPSVLERYQERFRHVLVDEYQDTNILQSEIVEMLAAGHNNLTVVGDDFQCIYSWRGADFRNIMEFPERHPDARIIKLERNYRSYPGILRLANACIAGNKEQFQKTLIPTREDPSDRLPKLCELFNGTEQAIHIIDGIKSAVGRGARYSDIAVLYRSHFHSIELQIRLAREGIPHITTSGTGVFELAHSKDLLAFFRLAEGLGDPLSLKRFLLLFKGLGEVTADKIVDKIGDALNLREETGLRALAAAFPPRLRAAWARIEPVFRRYAGLPMEQPDPSDGSEGTEKPPREKQAASQPDLLGLDGGVPDSGERAAPPDGASAPRVQIAPPTPVSVTRDFLDALYRDYLTMNYPDNPEDREQDVVELSKQIEAAPDVRTFLAEVSLLTSVDAAYAKDPSANRVTLSTIHQAKGLEWPIVFIPWVVDGMFPSSKSLDDPDAESKDILAEERRLFYVAVTRARDELTLYTPQVRQSNDGGSIPCIPSRFVREVPASLMRKIRPQFDFVPRTSSYGGSFGGRSSFGGRTSGGPSRGGSFGGRSPFSSFGPKR